MITPSGPSSNAPKFPTDITNGSLEIKKYFWTNWFKNLFAFQSDKICQTEEFFQIIHLS